MQKHQQEEKLRKRIKECDDQIIEMEEEVRWKQSRLSKLKNSKKDLEEALAELLKEGGREIRISDHALVRYFERVVGLDIAQVHDQIITPKLLEMVATLGAHGTFPNGNGMKITLRDGTIVTIMKEE